jgi:hypothetical protein
LFIYCRYTSAKEIKKVRAILEYFQCMIGNIKRPAHFVAQGQTMTSCECGSFVVPFVSSEHGVKMTAPLKVCTKSKQHATVFFGVSRNEWGRDPSTIGCHMWTELFATVKCV